MKILQVHKYLYRKAGAEAYLFDVAELLARHGHEVGMWGTSEKTELRIKNEELRILKPLVEPLNFDTREGIVRDLKKFGHMIWSFEAARKFEEVLKRFRPDVIHIHNIYHHLSPSILSVARRYKIPVVMTVHDYKLINPNYSLYDHGAICERDGLSAILHRCIQNSYLATLADVVEMTAHRMGNFYRRGVTRFLVPSLFAKEKLVQHGISSDKMTVLPLPVTPSNSPLERERKEFISPPRNAMRGGVRGGGSEGYILFAGRLVQEKGIYTVLQIAKYLRDIPFKIAGTGPELGNVELRIKNEELRNVELLGFQEKAAMEQLIIGARLILVPSLWYENSPYAVLEPMAAGKVVVASTIGGIPNLIQNGITGFLVDVIASETKQSHASPQRSPRPARAGLAMTEGSWVDAIEKVYYDEALLKKVGKAARQYIADVHDPERHYQALMEIYEKVLR